MVPDISVVIVNYNSSALAAECVNSITEPSCETIIVDNASSPEDSALLKTIEGGNVRVIFNNRNLGFARATNQGIECARGKYVMMLNPDTIVFNGCIDKLAGFLRSNPKAGAAGPRIWWDRGKTIQLPRGTLPSPAQYITMAISANMHLSPVLWRVQAEMDRRFWAARTPFTVEMLSGAAIMAPMNIFHKIGLLNENYPLYFEDSDWCRRLRQKGLKLYVVADAEICHFYNQSAKTSPDESLNKFYHSENLYMSRYFSGAFLKMSKSLSAFIPNDKTGNVDGNFIDLGKVTSPPTFSRGVADSFCMPSNGKSLGKCDVLFQFSTNPAFMPSAGTLLNSPSMQLSGEIWEYLARGVYFARLLKRFDTLPIPGVPAFKMLATWKFEKG